MRSSNGCSPSTSSSIQNVSHMSRAGWSSGMRRRVKLYSSSSTSGPSTVSKPIRVNAPRISCSVCATGCSPPRRRRPPWQRNVDGAACQLLGQRGRPQLLAALLERPLEVALELVCGLPDRAALLLREVGEPAQHAGQRARAAEHAQPPGLKRGIIGSRREGGASLALERVEVGGSVVRHASECRGSPPRGAAVAPATGVQRCDRCRASSPCRLHRGPQGGASDHEAA